MYLILQEKGLEFHLKPGATQGADKVISSTSPVT